MRDLYKLVASCLVAGMLTTMTSLSAQEQEPRTSVGVIEEVVVTARKREESLQGVPISLSVFNAADIQAADLKKLEDVANLTPGFQFFSQGNQEPGRYNTQLMFRGLTTAQFSPSFATGALFIDGIYVLNGGTSVSLMDVDRVEVIKGPQSAYFGRNTFGGAVNIITRDPNLDDLSGEVLARVTSESNNEYNVFLEGPIVSDKLAFSLGGRYYKKDGQYTATDGGSLGDEETKSINAVLKWQVSDNLSVKTRYGYSEDNDGAPAQGFISGIMNDTCTGKTIDGPDGEVTPTRYVCGEVPYGNAVVVDPGSKAISSNTFLPPWAVDSVLTDPSANLPGLPRVDEVGLRREAERFSVYGTWDIGGSGYTLDGSYGKNKQDANWIRDYDLSDRESVFSSDPQQMEDDSYEIRLSSPANQSFRWLAGYNSYSQKFISAGSGGMYVLGCFNPNPVFSDDYPAGCVGGQPGVLVLAASNTLENSDHADVNGVFGSLDYDISDHWTVSLEGRWQSDKLTKGGGLNFPGQPVLTETFDDFLPRAILRYMPTSSTNLYLQYAEGQLAGDFNTAFINADQRERAQYLAQDPRLEESLEAETLDAWEIGWKQGFAQGRGQVNLSTYYYTWKNIKGRSSFTINETCRTSTMGNVGCNPALGLQPGDPSAILDPSSGELIPYFRVISSLLPGDATIKGVELETWYFLTENLRWTFNMSYIDSKYEDYEFNFVQPIAGYSQMAGNQTPRQPKWSGNTALTYQFNLFDQPAYVRGDWIYQGKSYTDESNLAYISSYNLVNARIGLDKESWLVELFVTNMLDEEAWQTGSRFTNLGSPLQLAYLQQKQGINVAPLNRREFGARVSWRF